MEDTVVKKRIRLDSIQMLRGIAALLIVLFHSTQIYQNSANFNYLNWAFKFGFIGVDLFFVISGFIILYVHQDNLGQREYTRKYFKSRMFRIYPLYWIILFVVASVYFFIPTFGGGYERNIGYLFHNFLLIPHTYAFILPQTWTLTYEVIFYIVFGIGIYSNNKILRSIFYVWAIICGFNLLGVLKFRSLYTETLFNPVILEFLMGTILYYIVSRFKDKIKKLYSDLSIVIGVIILVILITMVYWDIYYGNRILFGLAFSIILFGIITKNLKYKRSYNKTFVLLGNSSYSIFLTHYTLLSASVKLLKKIDICNNFTISIVNLIIVILGITCYKVIEKPIWLKLR